MSPITNLQVLARRPQASLRPASPQDVALWLIPTPSGRTWSQRRRGAKILAHRCSYLRRLGLACGTHTAIIPFAKRPLKSAPPKYFSHTSTYLRHSWAPRQNQMPWSFTDLNGRTGYLGWLGVGHMDAGGSSLRSLGSGELEAVVEQLHPQGEVPFVELPATDGVSADTCLAERFGLGVCLGGPP